jgi:ATP-dependent protease ClpP protease subunit
MSEDEAPEEPAAAKHFRKTPLFQAFHAARYQRQALIQAINEATGTKLICYVAGLAAPIDRDDPAAFVDLLHNLQSNEDIDLLLHTGGGDIDAAEKLIVMLRQKVGTARLRVIVPDFAKSAGTLMTLGADVILMSDTSELGPIDPQTIRIDKDGNRVQQSVQDYLDAYQELRKTLAADPTDIAAQLLVNKLDPATLKHYENVLDRARRIAEEQLKLGMFKEKGNWSGAAHILIDTKAWPSHAQMISWQAATNTIGLNVEYCPPDNELWEMYWQLYCLQKLSINENQKLFESDYASLSIAS